MIVKVNFNISLQCSKCGIRLSFAENTNTDKYDSILEVEPHVCGVLTQRALDLAITCEKCGKPAKYPVCECGNPIPRPPNH